MERQYLLAAYGLAKGNSMRMFDEYEIPNRLDLDPNELGYFDRFVGLTNELMGMGFVEPFHKGGGMGRRALKLTRRGMEEGERLSDPVEQRKEQRRRFLRTVYTLADGSPSEFAYFRDMAADFGLKPGTQRPPREVRSLAEQLAGAGYIVIEGDAATAFRITARGVDEVEGNAPQPQHNVTNTFNMSGRFYQSAIGTHNTNNFSGDLDFSTVERRIEDEGGEDKDELRRLVAEMRDLLERGGTIDRGFLARFNDKLKEHGWLAGAVAGWLLNFSTQDL